MIFITQGRFTQTAMKGMVAKPEDRAEQVRGLIERAGGRMVAYYVTLGEYDFLIVSEGEIDLPSYMGTMAVAAAGGGVSDLKSTIALSSADMKGALEKAQASSGQFRSAGQA
ncbi:hypothetical protein Rumeso_01013 [Rubellimicrobium mesophilum DSM 19309]|uniref:GYD domain-containing protein n=1 Tax=Rubellimicrobium mesophilum DSM 19309 TaxID=442562 RepID=A0A017HSD6_9RHOB|nr:GYD domain-containing protein [Rubellimicrobium mesophilum]EYD77306.1 hypothetical protein Rumeso_01013 [Rubellimicrobium mesophilum DSM 19309]